MRVSDIFVICSSRQEEKISTNYSSDHQLLPLFEMQQEIGQRSSIGIMRHTSKKELGKERVNVLMNTNDVESLPNAKKMKFEELLSFSEKESWSVEQSLHNQSKFLRDMQLPLILQCGNLSSKITKVLLRMQQNSESAKVSIANQDLLLVNIYGEQVITLFENIHGI